MTAKRGGFVYTPEVGKFQYGPDHPFDPMRAVKVYELSNRYSLLDSGDVATLKSAAVSEADLLLAHTPEYLAALRKADGGDPAAAVEDMGIGTPDCPVFEGVYQYAELSVGASLSALSAVLNGQVQCAFNPSGGFHHAFEGRAEGFCYLNDIVVMLRTLLEAGKRPAFIDIDAHQPNGVIEPFLSDPSVLIVSMHETPRTLYPFQGYCEEMGEGPGKGYTVNVPLEPGADDEVFNLLLGRVLKPALDRFEPDFCIVEAGMDMLPTDPLAHLGVSSNALNNAMGCVKRLGVPVIMLGGGGYDARNTVRGWTRLWGTLIDREPVDHFAGAVGGMMFGPEMDAGTLIDPPVVSDGHRKAAADREAERVAAYIEENVLPLIKGR